MTTELTDFTTLTFDCYGTLIDWESGIVAALRPWLEAHGLEVGRAAVLEAFGEAESRRQAATPAALYPDILKGVFHDMAAGWGVEAAPLDAEAFAASVRDWPAFADSAEALAYLAGHFKLVIISNIDRASFGYSNDKLGVEFDLIVTAQDVGSYKPDLRNFRYTLERLAAMGVSAEQVLHCAQSLYHDHVPAKQIGLTTLWVNRHAGERGWGATVPPGVVVAPDFEVPTMAALAERHRSLVAG